MEEKRRDAGTLAPASSFTGAESEPASSRRRAGGHKRKTSSLSLAGAFSAPSKRITRDKGLILYPPIHNHNGPLTRARQGDFAAAIGGANSSPVAAEKPEEPARPQDGAAADELRKASREWEALEASIEAEVEAIRSRDADAHVVPTHCGWFSWTKPHSIEELTLPSFFDGKSSTRTSDMYVKIRNWIMKKFHANPNTQIESKDLSELEVGDLEARQEVMEFLDFWGLINFHPLLPKDPTPTGVDSQDVDERHTLIEKLYHFEVQPWRPPVAQKTRITVPTMASRLFPESSIAEELAEPEGPNVQYHCNSCSGDCSRKRYHCQKQADFDLCSDCFSDAKFDSNMSSADFIIMESAEVLGVGGGKWTDQENLLLLEGLELYKENWNEIAEHVATKTKAQCILQFVQMPIEDAFLDYDDYTDNTVSNADSSTPRDVPESIELKTNDPQISSIETSKPEDENEVKDDQETSKADKGSEVKSCSETMKHEDTVEVKVIEETVEDCALKALRDAFEAVNYPKPEGPLSFADVGNPAMALAAYLARLVEPDVVTASARCSLKSISGFSSGMQLAARHCSLCEYLPDDDKKPGTCGSTITGNDESTEKTEDSGQEKKQLPDNDESTEKPNAAEEADATDKLEAGSCNLNESNNAERVGDQPPSTLKESDDLESKVELPTRSLMDSDSQTPVADPSHSTEAPNNVEMASKSFPSDKNKVEQSVTINAEPTMVSKDVEMTSESLPSETIEPRQPVASDQAKDVEMVSDSLPPEKNDTQQSITADETGEVKKGKSEDNKEKSDSIPKKDQDIDKVKWAAISALSAAAVKAKFLANQEEEQIKELAVSLIDKQLQKLETKLGFFSEMDNVMIKVKEQMDRSRQKLFHERTQIIAARLGTPVPSSRAAMNFTNSAPRPQLPRPLGAMTPPSNPLMSTPVAGGGSITHQT